MADIEDRITKHSHAFEGLLSLVPIGEKRKLTKGEKRKEAKKAKLGPRPVGIDKGKIIREGKKENKKKKAEEPVASVGEKESAEKQEGQGKKKQQKKKSKPKQQKAGDETLAAEDGDGEDNGNTEAEEGKPAEKKLEPKSPPRKKTKVKTPAQPKEQSQKLSNTSKAPSGKLPKTSDNPPAESAPGSSSESTADTTPSSPSTTITTPDPESDQAETSTEVPTTKLEVSPEERAEARARLAAHIVALRSKRKADGASAKPRHALLEARQKKESARKERKKAMRLTAKLTEESGLTADTPSLVRQPPTEVDPKPKNDFIFGAVTFDDGQELDHTLADFKKTRKRKGPTDVMGQLKHVEAKKARLENMDPEKAEKIHEKELWSRALKQTAGEKVRDDEKLLKKALKRQQGEKRKSEREWKERKGSVAKGIAMRQKKREGNINARKEQKKLGKAGKKAKTGGKKKVQKKDRKGGSRPGPEGGMKSGKSTGKSTGKPAGKPAGKSSGGGGKRFG